MLELYIKLALLSNIGLLDIFIIMGKKIKKGTSRRREQPESSLLAASLPIGL